MSDKLIEFIGNIFPDNPRLVILIILSSWILIRFSAIHGFVQDTRRARERYIKEALTVEALGAGERVVLVAELNRLIIRHATGLAVDGATRREIFALIEQSKGTLQLSTFVRAQQFLFLTVDGLEIRIGLGGRIENIFHWIIAFYFLVMAVAVFTLPAVFSRTLSLVELLTVTGVEILLFLCSALFLFGTLPVSAAKKLAPKLAALKSNRRATQGDDPSGDHLVHIRPH